MLRDCADEVEADLARFYRIDLRDLWRGDLTPRRLGVLVAALPPESATMSKLAPQMAAESSPNAVPRQWSIDQQLLANVFDAVVVLTWTLRQVNSKERLQPPELMPRPGEVKAPPKRLTPEQRQLLATKARRAV